MSNDRKGEDFNRESDSPFEDETTVFPSQRDDVPREQNLNDGDEPTQVFEKPESKGDRDLTETSVFEPVRPQPQPNQRRPEFTAQPDPYDQSNDLYRSMYDPRLDEESVSDDISLKERNENLRDQIEKEVESNQRLTADFYSVKQDLEYSKQSAESRINQERAKSKGLWTAITLLCILLIASLFFLFNERNKRIEAESINKNGETSQSQTFNNLKNDRDEQSARADRAEADAKQKNDLLGQKIKENEDLSNQLKDKDGQIKDKDEEIQKLQERLDKEKKRNSRRNNEPSTSTSPTEDSGNSVTDLFRRG